MPVQESESLKIGALILVTEGKESPLPLESTVVNGAITGAEAQVRVTQRFSNPFKTPVELEYLFPLPHEAAVVDYAITIGSRRITAELKEAEAARKTYQQAVDAGQRASLLEQRRPNLFAIRIGNVQPGEKILCELEFEDRIKFEDGTYEFVFPMGITPRYHSLSQTLDEARSADTPYTQKDKQVGAVEITLTLDAGLLKGDPTSATHPLKVERAGETVKVGLDGKHIPNKDFVLRWRAADETIQAALWTTAEEDSEIGLLLVMPPRLSSDMTPPPREFIFVVDRSGSMSTEPMDQARNAVKACLRALNENDTFAIQAFDHEIEWLWTKPLMVTQENVEHADAWLDTIKARGGTEILGAMDAALAVPHNPERHRYVVFLTDGAVSADEKAISKIAKGRGEARIFTFGIGAAVNRFLLSKMAELGHGAVEFIGDNEDIEDPIVRFQNRVSYPALRDVELRGQHVDFWDTYPAALPDLYVDQPLSVMTRLKRKGKTGATVQIKGNAAGVERTFEVALPTPTQSALVGRLWARARIESLLDQQRQKGMDDKIRQQIISLALEHRIVTPYTSFVAVDSEVTTGGEAEKVRVSVPLPEGVEFDSVFGASAPAGAISGLQSVVLSAAASPLRFLQRPPMQAKMGAAPPSPPSIEQPDIDDLLADEADVPDWLSDSAAPLPTFDAMKQDAARKPTPKAVPPADVESLKDDIPALMRAQRVNGSWADSAAQTAQALLILIRAGHTTRAGSYRPQVKKAAEWLKAALANASPDDQQAAREALKALSDATGDDWKA